MLALIFSVTLLVFSMVSSQFGPRLMPHFLRDRTMQITLGLFLATFVHSLLTFAVAGQRGNEIFVPELAVLTDIGLVFASFGYLIVYNNRVSSAIQTNNVIPKIVENLYARSPSWRIRGRAQHPKLLPSRLTRRWRRCAPAASPKECRCSR